jgi:hypothetical protein
MHRSSTKPGDSFGISYIWGTGLYGFWIASHDWEYFMAVMNIHDNSHELGIIYLFHDNS